ncbi:MAG: hypothetical protein QOI21_1284 [Actinomycetota bacterium]|jgi:hypothetical protein|nr:hypothetical protein [Actinomycetota bacterium]
MFPVEQRLSPADQRTLLTSIGRLVRDNAPEGWSRIDVSFRQIGKHAELEPSVDGQVMAPPPGLGDLFSALRAGMYEPGRGAWLDAHFALSAAGAFDFEFARDAEPEWHAVLDEEAAVFADELAAFPRELAHIPEWWRVRAGLPLPVTFLHARVVDAYAEGKPPVVDRTPLSAEEIPLILQYLEREPAVLTGSGLGPDIFAPDAAPSVPESYHTDGTWIWHASVPHYLRKYGTPPETELIEHIRVQKFHPPYVEQLVRRTAEAELLGRPKPAPDPADLRKSEGEIAADRETQPNPELAEEDVLVVLVRRLGELGVWPEAYRLGERADGAWSLNFTHEGWEVARYADGEPVEPKYFPRREDAAQHLLGALLLHPARMTAGHETPLETAKELGDWPVQAAEGEPPLTLLRNKRLVRLVAGTPVLHFGGEGGNLVHGRGVRFATTSLPLERENEERSYVVRRPLYVITGITIPWANMPGGAVTYVLPKTLAEHLADGSVERTE